MSHTPQAKSTIMLKKQKTLPSLLFALSLSSISSLMLSRHCDVPRTYFPSRIRTLSNARTDKFALYSTNVNDEEAYLQGISVGIDLGTTNSALAMMIPSEDGT